MYFVPFIKCGKKRQNERSRKPSFVHFYKDSKDSKQYNEFYINYSTISICIGFNSIHITKYKEFCIHYSLVYIYLIYFSNLYYERFLFPLSAWFMAVQTFMTIALLASMTTLVTVSLILMRWPMQMIMRYEWHLTGFCFLCQAVTGK